MSFCTFISLKTVLTRVIVITIYLADLAFLIPHSILPKGFALCYGRVLVLFRVRYFHSIKM